MEEAVAYISSPLGSIEIRAGRDGITRLTFADDSVAAPSDLSQSDNDHILSAARELSAYFRGELREFETRLDLRGTDFRLKVWRALREIPYGKTRSYGEIAASLGMPGAQRAVGGANYHNPIAIIVPCHRVIGADGKLVGYAGGLWRKTRLLELEGARYRS